MDSDDPMAATFDLKFESKLQVEKDEGCQSRWADLVTETQLV